MSATYFSFSWSRDETHTSGFGSCVVNRASPRTPEEFEAVQASIKEARGGKDTLVLLWWADLSSDPTRHPIQEP